MKETKTYHAVHDESGSIRSMFVTTSAVGARLTMTPSHGCFVSPMNLQGLKLRSPTLTSEEGVRELRELRKMYRVDTSGAGQPLKKAADRD